MNGHFFDLALFLEGFADPFAFVALIAACALGLGMLRRSYALAFFISVGTTFAVTHTLKSIFKVARPGDALVDATGYRFPSMHAAIAGVIAASFAWYLVTRTRHPVIKAAIVAVTALIVTLIAATRVYLGVHEMLDVVVGALLGTGIGILVHAALRKADLE